MITDVAKEVREQLKPFLNKRIEVEGTIDRLSAIWDQKARKEVPSVCVRNVEIREGDHPVMEHVWVTWAVLMKNAGVRPGDVVRFTAQVYEYKHRDPSDHNKTSVRLGLREPREFECMNRKLVDLESAFVEDERQSFVEPLPDVPPKILPVPETPADPRRELLDALWSLVDQHGLARVEKTLAAIKSLSEES